jgi:anti-sigma B factor antagonist
MYEAHPPGSDDSPVRGDGDSLAPTFGCGVTRDGSGVVASVRGELDLASAPELLRRLQHELLEPTPALSIDLGAASFIDSSGLGVLCQLHDEGQRRGVDVRLVNVPDHARRVLEITGLTGLFCLD